MKYALNGSLPRSSVGRTSDFESECRGFESCRGNKNSTMNKVQLKKPIPTSSSGLNYDELWEFYPHFFDKCSDILSKKYPDKTRHYVRFILEFLEDWGVLTWGQFYSVIKIHETYLDFKTHCDDGTYKCEFGDDVLVSRKSVQFLAPKSNKIHCNTDQDIDMLHKRIFGEYPRFEECEEYGMELSYNSSGDRIFLFPCD